MHLGSDLSPSSCSQCCPDEHLNRAAQTQYIWVLVWAKLAVPDTACLVCLVRPMLSHPEFPYAWMTTALISPAPLPDAQIAQIAQIL